MNRKERRTRGKALVGRLRVLKNSTIINDIDLKDVPKDVLDLLIANSCENKELQRKYNRNVKYLSEIIEIESELEAMRQDLAKKQSQTQPRNIGKSSTNLP